MCWALGARLGGDGGQQRREDMQDDSPLGVESKCVEGDLDR